MFLGREGTLRADSVDEIKLLPGAAQAIRTVNESGRLAVVLTSQTDRSESLIRNQFESLLGHEGAFVDGMYACLPVSAPQTSATFFTKPAADLNIDIKQSWVIASGPVAIDAARKLGIHSILIQTGRPDRQLSHPPDFVCQDLLSAVRLITEKEQMPQ